MEHSGLQSDAQTQQLPTFQSAVMTVDNDLHDDDVDSMKFLCQGLVVGSKLKRADSVIELINLLQSAGHVTESDFFLLADLLQYIQRIDVLQSIGYEEREVMYQRRQQGSKVKTFFVLLFQIAEELPDEDVKKAGYMYGKVPRSQKLSSGKDLFTVMVQHQAVDPSNVAPLKTIFQSIERQDIVELIDRYTDTQGMSVMDDLEQNFARALSMRGMGDALDHIPPQDPPPPPPQLQPQKGSGFGNGLGASSRDIDVSSYGGSGSGMPLSTPCQVSDQYSTYTNPPSQPPVSPTAPLDSLQSFQQGDPSLPRAPEVPAPVPYVQPAVSSVRPAESVAPQGYGNYEIPWKVLDILSTKIPETYWPELSKSLGVPVTSDWSHAIIDKNHCLAVLKRWLDLPETRVMDSVGIKIFLVKALASAGSHLMAQEMAHELNIDYQAIMQESSSSEQSSNWDQNDVATTGSAAPESMRMIQMTLGNAPVAPMPRQPGPIQYYRMNRTPRGKCFIINNRDFYKDPNKAEAKQMISREGTDVDRDKLIATFQQLGFDVVWHDNLTDFEMLQTVQSVAYTDHSQFDCFVCCILSHGVHGALYGVNGITVAIQDLTAPFRAQACPSLSGKPKLFFFQACQGREKQEGHFNDMQTDALESDGPPELIPNESDFLLGYATVPGYVSYRSKTRGSWYITKLTDLLNKYAYDYDIHDILTLVNYEVGKGDALIDGGQYKQSPAPLYSLRKKLLFVR